MKPFTRRPRAVRHFCAVVSALPILLAMIAARLSGEEASLDSWPQFRGPSGQGLASQTGLPLRWSDRKNVVWKTAIPGLGWSSPVIDGDQIWLTTALDSGKSLRAICVDRGSGEIRQNIEVFHVETPGKIHTKNSHASPTPVIDGDSVFVHFGAHGLACLSRSGEVRWKVQLPYYHHHGPAASPALVGDLLFVNCDGFTGPFWDKLERADVSAPQFVVALDRATGAIRWKKPRQGRHSYATPLVIEAVGRTQIVSPGGDGVIAYDPQTGDELWSCRYTGYSLVPRPVFGHGLVYVCTGYDKPTLIAVRPDGSGDVTDTHIAWTATQAIPLTASPVLAGDELYVVNDAGIGSCLDARTGEVHWKRRLGGNYSASPFVAEGRLYLLSESGGSEVLELGTKFKKLASSSVPGRTFASPAIAGRAIYLRSEKYLYRIEENAGSDDTE